MSPAQALPKSSVSSPKVSRVDHFRPNYAAPSERAKASPEITHAWSIGVTEAGRSAPQERREESCPPEVYIG